MLSTVPPRILTGVMAPPSRRRLAPRFVLFFAVFTCLLGIGQASAAVQVAPMTSSPLTVGTPSGHDGQGPGSAAPAAAALSPAVSAFDQADTNSGVGLAMTCMTAAAAIALGALAAAANPANLVTQVLVAARSRMHTAVLAVSHPRPPNLRNLCVQRI